jgi:tetratricopeptide (TPR) repeat protein
MGGPHIHTIRAALVVSSNHKEVDDMRSITRRDVDRLAAMCCLLGASLAVAPAARADGPENGKAPPRVAVPPHAGRHPGDGDGLPKSPPRVERIEELGIELGIRAVEMKVERVGGTAGLFVDALFTGTPPPKNAWLHATVVLKSLDCDLAVEGKVSPNRCARAFHTFTVKEIKKLKEGDLLSVVDNELLGLKGWLNADKVVVIDKAEAYFTAVIKREPRAAMAYYQRGSLGNSDQALADLTEAIRIDPTLAAAHVAVAEIQSQKKNFACALAELTEAIRIDPQQAAAYSARAKLFNQKKEPDRAIADLTEAIRINPAGFRLFAARGLVRIERDDCARAVSDLTEAIRLVPRDQDIALSSNLLAQYHLSRGIAYQLQEKHEPAVADFAEAIRTSQVSEVMGAANRSPSLTEPMMIGAIFNRANACYAKGDFDRAIAHYTGVIKVCSKAKLTRSPGARFRALAYVGRGRAHESNDDVDAALADYADALRHDPEPLVAAVACIGRSGIESDRNDLETALVDRERSIQLVADRWFVYLNRAQVLNKNGRYAGALADCGKACEVAPRCPWGHDYRAWIRATCPDAEFRDGRKAVEEATLACELTEWNSPTSLETLAAAAAESGEFDVAVKWQSRALEIQTDAQAKARYRDRLELFLKKQAYREVPSMIANRPASHSVPEFPLNAE